MLDKIMPNVTLDYLEGHVDCNGNERPSIAVGGDPISLRFAEESAEKQGTKNPSLTIVFRDPISEDKLGQNFTDNHLKFAMEMLFPGVNPNNYPPYAAYLHRNKSNHYELNLRILQIHNGRKFQLYNHRADLPLRKAFSDLCHAQNTMLTYPNSKVRLFTLGKTWSAEQKAIYEEANMIAVHGLCRDTIRTRKDLEQALRDAGMVITPRMNSIVVERDGIKNLRLKGKILEPDFVFDGRSTLIANSVRLEHDDNYYLKKFQHELIKRKQRLTKEIPEIYELTSQQRPRSNRELSLSDNSPRSTTNAPHRTKANNSRNSSELESDSNRRIRDDDRREDSSKTRFSFEQHLNVFGEEFGKILSRAGRRNRKAFSRIRQISHALTQTAIALFQRAKIALKRTKGGDGYGR